MQSEPTPVRVVVVDDHAIVREGLRWMLGSDSGVEIVGEAATIREANEVIAACSPDVVLLDVHLPDGSGIDALSELGARFPDLRVVILSQSDQPAYVESAVRAGAVGYLVKNAPAAELIRAVTAAASGAGYIQAEVTRPLLAQFARDVRSDAGDLPHLSPRELEVVRLLAEGHANKQIASELGLSEATVKGYLRETYEKLGATDRAQAVAVALRRRLID